VCVYVCVGWFVNICVSVCICLCLLSVFLNNLCIVRLKAIVSSSYARFHDSLQLVVVCISSETRHSRRADVEGLNYAPVAAIFLFLSVICEGLVYCVNAVQCLVLYVDCACHVQTLVSTRAFPWALNGARTGILVLYELHVGMRAVEICWKK